MHKIHLWEEHHHHEMDGSDATHAMHDHVHTTTPPPAQAAQTSHDLNATPSHERDAPTPTEAQETRDYPTGHGWTSKAAYDAYRATTPA